MAGIVNLLSQMFVPQTTQVTVPVSSTTSNPYSNNPFVNYNGNSLNTYAKNSPVRGGYFAGYYNGKQNIVGQRLFIEV
ncbi:MAG: hypothetical protein ACLSA2_02560 [Candidatus Gastranaerophilaceae bacterium]|nr:unknown [Clostridium sp. CAG:967]